jgi:hypothetical protein
MSMLGAVCLAVLGASGCGEWSCTRHSDCDPGLYCGPDALCVAVPDAAPAADGSGEGDAAPPPDAGQADADIDGADAGGDAAPVEDASQP